MNTADNQYLGLLSRLVEKLELVNHGEGNIRDDRTHVGTVSVFGPQMRFNLQEGFPLLTSKYVHFPAVFSELVWFIRGDTNIKYLLEHNNHIWTVWRYKEYLEHAKDYKGIEEPISMKEFEQLILTNPDVATAYGDIGKGYGHQWRNFGEVQLDDCDTDISEAMNEEAESGKDVVVTGFDQLSWVINEIKTNPTSRRLIVSGWNPQDMDSVDLPPCHTLFQFFVEPMPRDEQIAHTGNPSAGVLRMKATAGSGGKPHNTDEALDYFNVPKAKLSCQLYQRSADIFLGVPFNIASYAALTHAVAQECGLAVGEFIWTGGDVHLYSNHLDQARKQLYNPTFEYPVFELNKKPFFELEPRDFIISGYYQAGKIEAEVAV